MKPRPMADSAGGGVSAAARCVLLAALTVAAIAGCYTSYNLATQRQELSFTSTEREIRMGEGIAKHVLKTLKPVKDEGVQERVRALGARLAAQSSRQELPYHFYVVEGEEINAFTVPGGQIFVNEALVRFAKGDDELAAVLAHEVGHTAARHPVKRYESMMTGSIAQTILAVGARDAAVSQGTSAILTFLFLDYSREDELLADRLAVGYLRGAGFDPEGMVRFIEHLKRHETPHRRPRSYFRTHPYMAERLSVVREAISGTVGFTDYINRTDDAR